MTDAQITQKSKQVLAFQSTDIIILAYDGLSEMLKTKLSFEKKESIIYAQLLIEDELKQRSPERFESWMFNDQNINSPRPFFLQ